LSQLSENVDNFNPIIPVLVLGEEVLETSEFLGLEGQRTLDCVVVSIKATVVLDILGSVTCYGAGHRLGFVTQHQFLIGLESEWLKIELVVVHVIGLFDIHRPPIILQTKRLNQIYIMQYRII
jgi:hypothetical protein